MSKILALDIETTGLHAWKNDILMCGLWDGNQHIVCREKLHLLDCMRYARIHQADLVCHNAAFDIKFLQVKDLWQPDGRIIHDTSVMASLVKHKIPKDFLIQYETDRIALNKTLPKGKKHRQVVKRDKNGVIFSVSLKVVAPWYLKVPRFWENPGQYDDEEYNKLDCQYTYQLFHLFEKMLKEEGSWDFYMNKMLKWSEMLRNMELRGICIDPEAIDQTEAVYGVARATHAMSLNVQWNVPMQNYRAMQAAAKNKPIEKIPRFNLSSPKQMAWLLKEGLGLNITNPEGKETTGKAVLQRLAAEGRDDIKTYLNWRETDKVLTMYLPTYKELAHENVIHPSFNITGTRTGRLSSSGPNLQQVPPKLYSLFTPRPGHKFIQYDLSGIEAVLIALYSGDRTLYDILSKGESIHDHNAKALFGLTCDVHEVSLNHIRERKCIKNNGFAGFYGASWRRIKSTHHAAGFMITDKEAKMKHGFLKEKFSGAFKFHKEITAIFESGETVHNLLGRPLAIQPWENAYMQGFNTLIQSSASDLNLEACRRYAEAGGNPLLVIHDCIIAEEPEGLCEARSATLRECMTGFNLMSEHGPIQLRVEGGISERWEK